MGYIHPLVSEICDPQSLDPICGKFDKFLAHGQAHMEQMGKWPWQYITRGLDNSTELRMEKIHQAVTEIWVPQVWQPPARTVTTKPLQPGGLRGKICLKIFCAMKIEKISNWIVSKLSPIRSFQWVVLSGNWPVLKQSILWPNQGFGSSFADKMWHSL